MKHPLVGTLVSGHFEGAYRLARVTNVVFPKRGIPYAVGRVHGGQDTLVEARTWDAVLGRYKGPSVRFPFSTMRQVLPGDGEGWVDAVEFMEWSEA
jgi:hypothetical protein